MVGLFQLALVVLVAVMDFGVFGRQHNALFSTVSAIVLIWAFTWFGSSRDAMRLALLLGGAYGLISFLPLLTWPIIFIGAYFIIDLLKQRFFDLSSFPLALLTLLIISAWSGIVLGTVTESFEPVSVIAGTVANAFYGTIIYYALGTRFKFLQRWAGRRL